LKKRIRKVAIVGSGTMGGGIAALLAGAGIRSYLLDIVPRELTDQEKAAGLTTDSPAFRNRIADNNKALLLKSKPAQFMLKSDADLITTGNTEDHIGVLAECDWVVEVVSEVIEIKKAVLKNIAANIKPGTFVTSNTSSISINKIVKDMPLEFRQHWMGTHFFNPVRYMKLLELIPGKDTLPEVVQFFAEFGERVLGKGIVYAKDTPAFVANRLGNWAGPSVTQLMMEFGLTVPEIDALTGAAIGRPGTGTFGLFDMVGIDIAVLSTAEIYHNVSDPVEKAMYTPAPFLQKMMDNNMLGAKTQGGFYKKVTVDGKKVKQVIDVNTFEYGPVVKPELASLAAAKAAKGVPAKVAAFFESDDKGAQFVWRHVAGLFLYAASKIPEVSDDILNMDRALNWGYNHQMGPFQLFSALDLPKYIARMKAEGMNVPAWIDEMMAAGINSFYKTEKGVDYYYSIPDKKYVAIATSPAAIILLALKAQNKVVKANNSSTLYDLGDGVLGLDTHSMANCVTLDLIDDIAAAQAELAKADWVGMVISGAGKDFMGNANDFYTVMNNANEKKWDVIEAGLKKTQQVYDANKYSLKPVVVAVKGKVLGGGCELMTQSSAIQASGETYAGHIEIGFGLIPAGGGIKESILRVMDCLSKADGAFPDRFIQPEFEAIAQAKVATSAKEVIKLGYMRPTDGISLNEDFLLSDAKKRVLAMLDAGYSAPVSRPFKAFGQTAVGILTVGTGGMVQAGMISEYDWKILRGIINIYAGGGVITGGEITETYLEELERELFLKLVGKQKTLDRILSMVTKGKPLRN
jgi:3-hydroxyacyl-CoA dehydrogenase